MPLSLMPPATDTPEEPVELIIFAAASMTETLTELGEAYMAEHENVNIVFNFDSSGTLKTQIQEGADCDIFISAGQKQMDELDIKADPRGEHRGAWTSSWRRAALTSWRTRSPWRFPRGILPALPPMRI